MALEAEYGEGDEFVGGGEPERDADVECHLRVHRLATVGKAVLDRGETSRPICRAPGRRALGRASPTRSGFIAAGCAMYSPEPSTWSPKPAAYPVESCPCSVRVSAFRFLR